MSWIADVIYGLKFDNGSPVTINRDSMSMNLITGTKTGSTATINLNWVIPLPLNMRQAFFKAINLVKESYLQPGESQFAVDVADLSSSSAIKINDYLVDSKSRRFDITNVENINDEILILTGMLIA